jgi:hypothetical protein
MTGSESFQRAMDPIAALREHAAAGVCSVVIYRKSGGASAERVIEPTHLLPGFEAILIRGIQRDPDSGVRLLEPTSLFVVSPSELRRSVPAHAFVAEDLDRLQQSVKRAATAAEARLATYVDAVRRVMSDLTIDGEEVEHIETRREMLGISLPEMRAAHAVVFSEILRAFSCDWVIDASEEEQIERALRCLDELGWAPQT